MFLQYLLSETGLINQLLAVFGADPRDWIHSSAAFGILILLYLWKYAGYDMTLLLAGMNMIPKEQTESASLDGARGWQIFFYNTLPQLIPVLFFTFVISVVNSFKIYREAFLLGGNAVGGTLRCPDGIPGAVCPVSFLRTGCQGCAASGNMDAGTLEAGALVPVRLSDEILDQSGER